MIWDRIAWEILPVQGFILSRAHRQYTAVVGTLPLAVGYSVMIFTQALIKDKSEHRFLLQTQYSMHKISMFSINITFSGSVWKYGMTCNWAKATC